jgi:hypothetical protein
MAQIPYASFLLLRAPLLNTRAANCFGGFLLLHVNNINSNRWHWLRVEQQM